MLRTPPKGFVKKLKSFDKDLRVRWSEEKNKWIIERKTPKIGLYPPVKWYQLSDGTWTYKILPEKSDLYIQYHDGYAGILYANELDNRIFESLYNNDLWKYKRKEDMYRDIEEKEKKQEENKEKEKTEEIKALSREIWDYWNVRGVFNKGGII